MNFSRALVRPPGKTFAQGLTEAGLGAPVLARACRQHARYVSALRKHGVTVYELPPEDRFPDSTFVEDCAVMVDGKAIWTRPGAPSRQGEVPDLKLELAMDHPSCLPTSGLEIEPPGTVDGGDVCCLGKRYVIGLSDRTNEAGAARLSDHLEFLGFEAAVIDVRSLPGLLHLKSGLTYLGHSRALVAEALVGHPSLKGLTLVAAPASETYAANCVALDDATLLFPAGYPVLAKALREAGFTLVPLETSEFRKMDGGLSCLSLRW